MTDFAFSVSGRSTPSPLEADPLGAVHAELGG
jgi:hypothetical protein